MSTDHFRNKANEYPETKREYSGANRFLIPCAFTCVLSNGEEVTRDWLVYSQSKINKFCFPCILFSSDRSIKLCTSADNDGKNMNQTLKVRNKRQTYKLNLTLSDRSSAAGCIDEKLPKTMCEQRNYWNNVLSVVLQQLPFFVKEIYHFRKK